MSTDIKGYTALVQNDETKALAMVERYQAIVANCTESGGGQVISFYGDGSLAMFDGHEGAIEAAIEMQRAFMASDLPVRIGLHYGDVTIEGNHVLGNALKMAAAVESCGVAGGVVISETVQSQLSPKSDVRTMQIGRVDRDGYKGKLYAVVGPDLAIPRQGGRSGHTRFRIGVTVAIILVAAVVAGFFIKRNLDSEAMAALKQERIAVRFVDKTVEGDQQALAEMAASWLTNRIQEEPGASVVGYAEAMDAPELKSIANSASRRNQFARTTGAANILEGEISTDADGSLSFSASILDLQSGNLQITFGPVACDPSHPMNCIEDITSEILGWWASRGESVTSVPNYEAFRAYLTAQEVWLDDEDLAHAKLLEAIREDSNFIDPYFMLWGYYSNTGQLEKKDSIVDVISRFDNLSTRQDSLLNSFKAYRDGNLVRAFTSYLHELQYDSTHLFANTEVILYAVEYVNACDFAIDIFELIPVESLNFSECEYCAVRVRMAIRAYLKTGNIARANELAIMLPDNDESSNYLHKMMAFTAAADTTRIDAVVSRALATEAPEASRLWGRAAYYFKLWGNERLAKKYAMKGLALYGSPKGVIYPSSIEASILLDQYDYPVESLLQWLQDYPGHRYVLQYAAKVMSKAGHEAGIAMVKEQLQESQVNDPRNRSFYTYLMGVVEFNTGNVDRGFDLLEQAYQEGQPFVVSNYDFDVDLIPYFDDPRFQRLLRPLQQ